MADDTASGGVSHLVALVGSAVAILGAFLPWLQARIEPNQFTLLGDERITYLQQGLDLQGTMTAALALLVIVLVVFRRGDRLAGTAVVLAGGVLTVVPVLYLLDPGLVVNLDSLAGPLTTAVVGASGGGEIAYDTLNAGVGLYLTLVGGLLVLAGGGVGLVRDV